MQLCIKYEKYFAYPNPRSIDDVCHPDEYHGT